MNINRENSLALLAISVAIAMTAVRGCVQSQINQNMISITKSHHDRLLRLEKRVDHVLRNPEPRIQVPIEKEKND